MLWATPHDDYMVTVAICIALLALLLLYDEACKPCCHGGYVASCSPLCQEAFWGSTSTIGRGHRALKGECRRGANYSHSTTSTRAASCQSAMKQRPSSCEVRAGGIALKLVRCAGAMARVGSSCARRSKSRPAYPMHRKWPPWRIERF